MNKPLTKKEINERLAEYGIKLIGIYKNNYTKTRFRCFCGNIFYAQYSNVMLGRSSCGCRRFGKTSLEEQEVIKRLKKLKMKLADKYNGTGNKTKVICHCGTEFETLLNGVFRGITKSCGCSAKGHSWKGTGEISKTYWNAMKYGAKDRKIPFKIKIHDAWNLFIKQDRRCALSGVEIKMSPRFGRNVDGWSEQTASLDRIDSSKPYTIDNVQWVHKRINFMKQAMQDEEFIYFCHQVSKYNKEIIDNAISQK